MPEPHPPEHALPIPGDKQYVKVHTKYRALASAILDNERLIGTTSYQVPEDLAKMWNVPRRVIYYLRNKLGIRSKRREGSGHFGHEGRKGRGSVPTAYRNFPAADRITTPHIFTTSAEDLLKILEHEPLLTQLDRLRILSRLIRTGAPAVKIQGIKAYEELTRSTTERVGPPEPLNDEERVARLARLMMAVGPDITAQAQEVAFAQEDEGLPPGTAETPLRADEEPLLETAEEAEQPMPDLPQPDSDHGETNGSGPQP